MPTTAFAWRLVVTIFALLTFTAQSYVTQTHIHIPGHVDFADGVPAKFAPSHTGDHEKYPGKDDPANCPLCQAVAYAGAFVTPSLPVLILPAEAAAHPVIAIVQPDFVEAVSHNWHGRAPPAY